MTEPILKRSEHGFDFGAAKVEALASDKKSGWVMVGVTTPKMRVQVYVTKTGKTRVYVNGLELVTSK